MATDAGHRVEDIALELFEVVTQICLSTLRVHVHPRGRASRLVVDENVPIAVRVTGDQVRARAQKRDEATIG